MLYLLYVFGISMATHRFPCKFDYFVFTGKFTWLLPVKLPVTPILKTLVSA
jgi:hypothetical protein